MLEATLLNGSLGDPVLWLRLPGRHGSVLCDCGTVDRMPVRDLLRVDTLLVSHGHLDHLGDLSRLLRTRLAHAVPLRIVGPAAMGDRIEAQLGGYSWTLIGPHSPDFTITVDEFVGAQLATRAVFRQRNRFRREDAPLPEGSPGCAGRSGPLLIRAAELDHGTASIAYAVETAPRLHFDIAAAQARGLAPGPWVGALKALLRTGAADPATTIGSIGALDLPRELGSLADLVSTRPGTRIGYVTDVADTPGNAAAIVRLAEGADHLFIESCFADEDIGQARARHHLTAGRAGEIGRLAGVGALTPMHISARYGGDPERVLRQVEAGFGRAVRR